MSSWPCSTSRRRSMSASEAQQPANPLREGLARRKSPDPCIVVLFGASGDLTQRKLVPALYNLAHDGLAPAKLAIVGFARREKTDDQFRAELLEGVKQHARDFAPGDPLWEEFARSIFYQVGSFEDVESFRALAARLTDVQRTLGLP